MGMRKFAVALLAVVALSACGGGDSARDTFDGYAEGLGFTDTRAVADAVCADDSTKLARLIQRDIMPRYAMSDEDIDRLLDAIIPLAQDAYCPTAE